MQIIPDGGIPSVKYSWNRFKMLDSFAEFTNYFGVNTYERGENRPFKSFSYLERRYYKHPSYQYSVVGIEKDDKVRTAVVFRLQECNNSKAVRIVDVIGDIYGFRYFTDFFDRYSRKTNAEYVDIYETGIPEEDMLDFGWKKVKGSGNIIPNYFAPYLEENIDIFYSTSDSRVVLFRGDGDQDRPN